MVAKFGGQRRRLHAYLDQLETLPSLKNNDVQGLEKFADLVRITVVKLRAEGREGELKEGTLHGLLVKKLGEKQVESYSRWLSEHKKERSVTGLKDWLNEEVKIRVEAMEMVRGVEGMESVKKENGGGKSKLSERGRFRSFFVGGDSCTGKDNKPPCTFCMGNHGVWSCRRFQSLNVKERWDVAKSKHLCFRCLGSSHQGRSCPRSKSCGVGGCNKNHRILLHDNTFVPNRKPENENVSYLKQPDHQSSVSAGEGAVGTRTHTANSQSVVRENVSLRTIPVWLKVNNRKVKINAILDDASNETFLNEDVAGVLGIQEPPSDDQSTRIKRRS